MSGQYWVIVGLSHGAESRFVLLLRNKLFFANKCLAILGRTLVVCSGQGGVLFLCPLLRIESTPQVGHSLLNLSPKACGCGEALAGSGVSRAGRKSQNAVWRVLGRRRGHEWVICKVSTCGGAERRNALLSPADEPISPSVDQEAALIPPSAVISVAQSASTGASSPGSPCPPIRRQLSHDQGEAFFGPPEREFPVYPLSHHRDMTEVKLNGISLS